MDCQAQIFVLLPKKMSEKERRRKFREKERDRVGKRKSLREGEKEREECICMGKIDREGQKSLEKTDWERDWVR